MQADDLLRGAIAPPERLARVVGGELLTVQLRDRFGLQVFDPLAVFVIDRRRDVDEHQRATLKVRSSPSRTNSPSHPASANRFLSASVSTVLPVACRSTSAQGPFLVQRALRTRNWPG